MERYARAEPTCTMAPWPRGRMRRNAASVPHTAPRYVTSVARRKVAGVKDETLEMLHALVAELGVVELEKELTQFEAQERAAVVEAAVAEQVDERESNP